MSTEPTAATPGPRYRWSNRILIVLFVTIFAPLGLSVLYNHAPGEHSFYPPCIFHWLTGLHCAGCGATRCLHALLHLDLPQAFAYNAAFVLASPFLAYAAGCTLYTMWTGHRVRGYRIPGWATIIVMIVLLAYSILRNIPMYPFDLLAPHQLPS
jgi:hypothetical protein